MKIDKKTLFQYIFLALLLIGVSYYYFFYSPIEKRIADLESEKVLKEQELQNKQIQALKERGIDDQILAANKNIEELKGSVFVDISQAEALIILTELNKKGKLVFDSVALKGEEESGETGFKDVELRIDYMGDYSDVMSFMKEIRKYDKNIALINANFEVSKYQAIADIEAEYSDEEEQDKRYEYIGRSRSRSLRNGSGDGESTSGTEGESGSTEGNESGEEAENTEEKPGIANLMVNMNLVYTSLPKLRELGWQDKEIIKSIQSKRELAKGPFNIYPDYLEAVRVQKEAEQREKELAKAVPDSGNSGAGAEQQKPRFIQHSFEDGAYFFVGSDQKMDGSIANSVVAKNGVYSADFQFDFLIMRPINTANLVFSKPQMLYKPAESMLLQTYAYEFSGHEIGVVVRDSMRREHKIPLSKTVDWVGWKELKADIPQEVAYPCLIQRIYVEGTGSEQKRMGRFLFDQLELEYPAETN
ncbi:MAG: hypothetical protein Q4A41_00630 [Bacillota bacterium]|nr:hypothetical protein [Bacillota bacterium]